MLRMENEKSGQKTLVSWRLHSRCLTLLYTLILGKSLKVSLIFVLTCSAAFITQAFNHMLIIWQFCLAASFEQT